MFLVHLCCLGNGLTTRAPLVWLHGGLWGAMIMKPVV